MMENCFPRFGLAFAVGAGLLVIACAKGDTGDDVGGDTVADGGTVNEASTAHDVGTSDSAPADTGVPADTGSETPDTSLVDAGACPPPASCHPLINELRTEGPGGANDEFVEIYNPCAQTFALTGWKLIYHSATGTSDVTLSDLGSFSLTQAQPYLLIVGSTYSGGGTADDTLVSGGLGATGGGVAIKNGTSVVDSMGYGTATNDFVRGAPASTPPAGSAMSMSRIPNGCDHGHNDQDFVVRTATPRAPN